MSVVRKALPTLTAPNKKYGNSIVRKSPTPDKNGISIEPVLLIEVAIPTPYFN